MVCVQQAHETPRLAHELPNGHSRLPLPDRALLWEAPRHARREFRTHESRTGTEHTSHVQQRTSQQEQQRAPGFQLGISNCSLSLSSPATPGPKSKSRGAGDSTQQNIGQQMALSLPRPRRKA